MRVGRKQAGRAARVRALREADRSQGPEQAQGGQKQKRSVGQVSRGSREKEGRGRAGINLNARL